MLRRRNAFHDRAARFGTRLAGALSLPLNTRLASQELASMAKEAQLVVLLVHAMYQDLWDAIRANLPADESHELVVSRSGLVPPGGMTG